MTSKIPVLCMLVISFLGGIGAISQGKICPSEQVHFSVEDKSVKQPISIPPEAWSILKRDRNVAEVLDSQKLQPDQLPASWFAASEVHLDGPNEKDFVVIGKEMLQGANVTTFWIFAQMPQGLKLVLMLPAHNLSIKPVRTNGFRNIQATMMTAGRVSTAVFRFNGEEYRRHKDSTKNIP